MRNLLPPMAWLIGLVACGATPEAGPPPANGEVIQSPVAVANTQRPGIRFDPATIAVGQRIGTLTVDSVSVTPAFNDTVLVGTVRFAGELTLTGSVMAHFDAEAQEAPGCFEADPTGAATMPRWAGDERRPWFCFSNGAEALRLLGGAREGEVLTVSIREFTIHRGFSDQVNAAELVARQP
jgi:hypothetical protein